MNKFTYMGNGSTKAFGFTFPFFDKDDVVVSVNGSIATSGYIITLTENGDNSDYPYIGGTVKFNNAPISTDTITIYRQIVPTRPIDYQPTEEIEPEDLNQDFNFLLELVRDNYALLESIKETYTDLAKSQEFKALEARMTATMSAINGLGNIGELRNASTFTATGRKTLAGFAMPSNQSIDISTENLAAGLSYIAPANGYITFAQASTAAGQWVNMENTRTRVSSRIYTGSNDGYDVKTFVPAAKGDGFYIRSTLGGTVNYLKFVYAQGEI